jgi:ActR/RegA family two-component response regulator
MIDISGYPTSFILRLSPESRRGAVLYVLIAEDDLMIADLIEDCLINAGYKVCGIARTVTEGIALAQLQRPDLAIIDMRLADGGLGTEIVTGLHAGPRIGILYASGNINQVIELADGDACIAKPYHTKDILRALRLVEQILEDGIVAPPYPPGFHLLASNNPPPWGSAHA